MDPMCPDFANASLRTIQETSLRFAALHIVAAASFGHLLSLRSFSHRRSWVMLAYLFGYIVFPTMPMAVFLRQIFLTMLKLTRQPYKFSIRYFIAACLGMHAVTSDGSRGPIIDFDPHHLTPKRQSYNLLWFGRCAVLGTVLVQYIGAIWLYTRRLNLHACGIRVWNIDTRAFQIAFGGVIISLWSVAITALNTDWELAERLVNQNVGHEEVEVSITQQARDLSTPLAVEVSSSQTLPREISCSPTSPSSTIALEKNVHQESSPEIVLNKLLVQKGLSGLKRAYTRFHCASHAISKRTFRYYPQEYQWDLEFAYLLRVMFLFLLQLDSTMPIMWLKEDSWPYWNPLYLWWSSFNDRFHRILGVDSGEEENLDHSNPHLVRNLYLLPFVVLLLHHLLWAFSFRSVTRSLPNGVNKALGQADFWLRSGRTMFSLLLTLLLFIPLIVEILATRQDMRIIQSYAGQNDARVFWKDSWSDKLWLI